MASVSVASAVHLGWTCGWQLTVISILVLLDIKKRAPEKMQLSIEVVLMNRVSVKNEQVSAISGGP